MPPVHSSLLLRRRSSSVIVVAAALEGHREADSAQEEHHLGDLLHREHGCRASIWRACGGSRESQDELEPSRSPEPQSVKESLDLKLGDGCQDSPEGVPTVRRALL